MIVTLTGSRPAAARSASARKISGVAPWCVYRYASVAPVASAASCSPSSTRFGAARSSSSSLRLAGSLSAPLATTTFRPRAWATMASFRYTGKAAPPRPVRPEVSMSPISKPVRPRYGVGPYLARWWRRSSGAAGSRRGSAAARRVAGSFTVVVIVYTVSRVRRVCLLVAAVCWAKTAATRAALGT